MNLIEQLGGYELAKIIQGSREMGGLPYDLDLEDASSNTAASTTSLRLATCMFLLRSTASKV